MPESKFKVGDIVNIKSDSITKMTVNEVKADGYECMWFDITVELKKDDFKEAVLELSN